MSKEQPCIITIINLPSGEYKDISKEVMSDAEELYKQLTPSVIGLTHYYITNDDSFLPDNSEHQRLMSDYIFKFLRKNTMCKKHVLMYWAKKYSAQLEGDLYRYSEIVLALSNKSVEDEVLTTILKIVREQVTGFLCSEDSKYNLFYSDCVDQI